MPPLSRVLVCFLLAGPLAAVGGPAPAALGEPATPGVGLRPAQQAAPAAVEVKVTTLSPRGPLTGDEAFQVTGQLVNRGPVAVTDLRLRLLVDDVLRSRGELARSAAQPGTGTPRGALTPPPVDTLEPGGSTTFDLRLRVRDLGLAQLGVYPLAVQARGRLSTERSPGPLGQASTFVPWFPDGPPRTTRIAWLWPLVDTPRRTPTETLLDPALEQSLADGGRLGDLLSAARTAAPGACDQPAAAAIAAAGTTPSPTPAAPPCRGEPVPVTFAVDAELLDTVSAMTEPYPVAAPGGPSSTRPASDAAVRWLAGLRRSLAGPGGASGGAAVPAADLLALPFADPDVAAVTRARTGLKDDVEQLRVLGRRLSSELTAGRPLDAVAWPPAGRLSSAALDASVGGGATSVVLDETALPPRPPAIGRTPGTRTDLSTTSAGRVTGLVVEDGLSRLLAAGPSDPGWQGERLAEQRWIAETAMIAAERPSEARTLLVAPPRRGAVLPAVGAEALLDSGRLPWLCAVRLSDVAAATERCPQEPPTATDGGRRAEDRGALQATDGQGELTPGYLDQVASVRTGADQLTDDVLLPGSAPAAAIKARILRARGRALSSAWRDQPVAGQRLLDLLRDDVDGLRGQVRLVTSGRVLLTGTSGVVDVSVSNGLDQPVTVGVGLNDPVEARLTSTDTSVRTIGPSQAVPVRVQVQTRTSGRFLVLASLLDRAGRPFGPPVELVARSNSYGRVALAVTGVGAGVLLVAAGARITRRALRARSRSAR